MYATVIQHVACEGPGPLLEGILEDRDIDYGIARMDQGDAIPQDADLMIVLGGPMNVYEEERYPYLRELDGTIRTFVEGGGHFIGFCLGGQLLAKALGAPVSRNAVQEIGVHQISLTREGRHDPLFSGVPRTFPSLEWHGDTFAVPRGGTLLATSSYCRNQAFRFKNAYGLQFHPEVTVGMLEEWTSVYGDDLRKAGLPADAVVAYAGGWEEDIDRHSRQILGNFLDDLVEE